MKRIIMIAATILCMMMSLLGFTCSSNRDKSTSGGHKNLTAAEFNKFLSSKEAEGGLLLDVRTQAEYDGGHIPGSSLIPVDELPGRIAEIEQYKNKPVMVYCRSGRRSMIAVGILKDNGFTDIINLDGGINSWIQRGFPVE